MTKPAIITYFFHFFRLAWPIWAPRPPSRRSYMLLPAILCGGTFVNSCGVVFFLEWTRPKFVAVDWDSMVSWEGSSSLPLFCLWVSSRRPSSMKSAKITDKQSHSFLLDLQQTKKIYTVFVIHTSSFAMTHFRPCAHQGTDKNRATLPDIVKIRLRKCERRLKLLKTNWSSGLRYSTSLTTKIQYTNPRTKTTTAVTNIASNVLY